MRKSASVNQRFKIFMGKWRTLRDHMYIAERLPAEWLNMQYLYMLCELTEGEPLTGTSTSTLAINLRKVFLAEFDKMNHCVSTQQMLGHALTFSGYNYYAEHPKGRVEKKRLDEYCADISALRHITPYP